MRLPAARGPVSAALLDALRHPPRTLAWPAFPSYLGTRAVHDEDLQLSLFLCYELHYRGWEQVDEDWEWEPSLLTLRAQAERRFLASLRRLVPAAPMHRDRTNDSGIGHGSGIAEALAEVVAADDGPSLAGYLQGRATDTQFREFVMHRSLYHLKEADPHTWGIPRLEGRTKAALVEIQSDEYGGGDAVRMHAELFRTTMAELDLDTGYGAYLERVPAITLATNNVISLFGLHRKHLGALLGHLAAFEMTSSLPNRRYGNGLRRLGGNATATRFYDEHVQADAVHEQIAAHDLCGSYVADHPAAGGQVLFGAGAALALDRLLAVHLLDAWGAGRSSLRDKENVRVAA